MRASDTSEVIFEDCRVPSDAVVGVEGEGFVNTMQVLDAGRIGIAALAVGLAQGAYEAARRYALERRQFGQPIARLPGDSVEARRHGDAHRRRAAADLSRRVAARPARRAHVHGRSSIAKLYSSEIAVRAAEECVQIHGGYGFVKDYPAEKFFRDVKLCTIGEGTSEIQRLVIARQLLGTVNVPGPRVAGRSGARARSARDRARHLAASKTNRPRARRSSAASIRRPAARISSA